MTWPAARRWLIFGLSCWLIAYGAGAFGALVWDLHGWRLWLFAFVVCAPIFWRLAHWVLRNKAGAA